MKYRNEMLAGAILACEQHPDWWGDLKYMRSSLVAMAVLSKYRRSRRSRRRDKAVDIAIAARCEAVTRRLQDPSLGIQGDFDGSFLEGFLEFLIEHGPEIIELILQIVSLFGEVQVSSWSVDEFDDEMIEVLIASASPVDSTKAELLALQSILDLI